MTWDEYFYKIALSVAENTKCMSRKVGAVLVKDKFIVSTGFNGPPMKAIHCNVRYQSILKGQKICPRKKLGFQSGEGLHLCPAAHAERNAIAIAARLGHPTDGCILYLTCGVACVECAKTIINAGIKEVVLTSFEAYEKEGITGQMLLDEAGVKVRVYDFLREE